MIKAVPLFLIALLLIDATLAVPQEARAEIKDKANGIAPASASPVQTKLWQYKRYNYHFQPKYHRRHNSNRRRGNGDYQYGDNQYLLAERDDGDKQLWRQNSCYNSPSYCESSPSYCESNSYCNKDLLEEKTDGAKQLWKQKRYNCKSSYKAPSCSASYCYPSYSYCDSNNYGGGNKDLLANRANDQDQNQDPDWGQNDQTGQVLVQYYNDDNGNNNNYNRNHRNRHFRRNFHQRNRYHMRNNY